MSHASRQAERKWRSSKQPHHLAEFKKAKNYATMILNKARTEYLTVNLLKKTVMISVNSLKR